jgi:hypothetical protein
MTTPRISEINQAIMSNIYAHKRITDILFTHWNKVRGERMFPAKEDINEFELKQLGVWDDIFIVEIFPLVQSNGYRFLYTGKNLANEFMKDPSGKFVKNVVTGFLDSSTDKYDLVSEQKRPLQEEEDYTSPENGMKIKYRQILLPLGLSDDGEVNAIIGGMRFITG